MEERRTQNLTKNTCVILILLLFERIAYYGVRSLLMLYLVSETFQLTDYGAMTIYRYIIYFLLFTQVVGGVFGDFIFKNKKSIFFGGLLAVLGCVNICFPNENIVYSGLALMTLGSGFMKPNILAAYGKIYYQKEKFLDTAFSVYYLVVNAGAFIGIALFAYISNEYGFVPGFGFAAVLYIIISLLALAISEMKGIRPFKIHRDVVFNVLYVILAISLGMVFWILYEIGGIQTNRLLFNDNFQIDLGSVVTKANILSISGMIILPLLVIFSIIWIKFHKAQFLKVAFGFLFGALALYQFSLISFANNENDLLCLLYGMSLFAVAETLCGPIVLSIITRYSNPKYLTIIMVVNMTVLYGGVEIINTLYYDLFNESEIFIKISVAVFFGITLLLFLGFFIGRKFIVKNTIENDVLDQNIKSNY
ncbi:POT-type proton-dependent oligopeptide transporter [Kordia jejudonensis]|uniref:POT-type proton-dependent oligopeptide transporter n=1 Tax=Kordia jejudonensis TaxID=1348245 RepID=UPI000629ADB4|nr:MFS transporter [Kordia jejudonensis]